MSIVQPHSADQGDSNSFESRLARHTDANAGSSEIDNRQLCVAALEVEESLKSALQASPIAPLLSAFSDDSNTKLRDVIVGRIATEVTLMTLNAPSQKDRIAQRVQEVILSIQCAMRAIQSVLLVGETGELPSSIVVNSCGVRDASLSPYTQRAISDSLFPRYVLTPIKQRGSAWTRSEVFTDFQRIIAQAKQKHHQEQEATRSILGERGNNGQTT